MFVVGGRSPHRAWSRILPFFNPSFATAVHAKARTVMTKESSDRRLRRLGTNVADYIARTADDRQSMCGRLADFLLTHGHSPVPPVAISRLFFTS
jgi:hypothetical protein